SYRALGRSRPGTIDVRRVGKQQQNTLRADLGQTREIAGATVNRRVVDLEVAGVNDRADRAPDREAHGIDDRVGDLQRFDLEGPEPPAIARRERGARSSVEEAMLG